MKQLEKRLSAIEARLPKPRARPIRRFVTWQKPGINPREDLRAHGYDVQAGDIVRVIITPPPRDEAGNIIGEPPAPDDDGRPYEY